MTAIVGGLCRPPNSSMPKTYLQTGHKDRERVKGLGARWDPARWQWYVPDGRDLAPFANWLPAAHQAGLSPLGSTVDTELTLPTKGISLMSRCRRARGGGRATASHDSSCWPHRLSVLQARDSRTAPAARPPPNCGSSRAGGCCGTTESG